MRRGISTMTGLRVAGRCRKHVRGFLYDRVVSLMMMARRQEETTFQALNRGLEPDWPAFLA